MEEVPAKKRKWLSLKRPEKDTPNSTTPGDDAEKVKKTLELKTPENRFAFTSAEAVEEALKGVVPENTKKATEWALRVFHSWQVACNDVGANYQCPEDILLTEDAEALSKCICYFVWKYERPMGNHTPLVPSCRY